jgi:hypothetical protein
MPRRENQGAGLGRLRDVQQQLVASFNVTVICDDHEALISQKAE